MGGVVPFGVHRLKTDVKVEVLFSVLLSMSIYMKTLGSWNAFEVLESIGEGRICLLVVLKIVRIQIRRILLLRRLVVPNYERTG